MRAAIDLKSQRCPRRGDGRAQHGLALLIACLLNFFMLRKISRKPLPMVSEGRVENMSNDTINFDFVMRHDTLCRAFENKVVAHRHGKHPERVAGCQVRPMVTKSCCCSIMVDEKHSTGRARVIRTPPPGLRITSIMEARHLFAWSAINWCGDSTWARRAKRRPTLPLRRRALQRRLQRPALP